MPTFTELVQQGFPIICSKRKDGAILIATRIPLDDIRLERWGWILTLSSADGVPIEDDTGTLKNGAGRRFPKIYLLPDLQNYIEKWDCVEWEEGYYAAGFQLLPSKNGASANGSVSANGSQEPQPQLLDTIKAELQTQLETSRNSFEEMNAEYFQQLQEETIQGYNILLERSKAGHEATARQLDTLTHNLEEASLQEKEHFRQLQEETAQHEETVTEVVKNTAALFHQQTIVALEEQYRLARQETVRQLEEVRKEIRTELASFTSELHLLGEQVKQALDELNPDFEQEVDTTQTADPASTAVKNVRKATTQIERITASHQSMSKKYFDSANEQSKQSFKYAWFLYFAAFGMLFITVLAAVFMVMLQLYGYAVLFGSIGTLGTTVTYIMGAISSFHAKTTQQFADAQRLLDRRYGSTIANAIIVGYPDDEHRISALDKVVDSLIRDEIKNGSGK